MMHVTDWTDVTNRTDGHVDRHESRESRNIILDAINSFFLCTTGTDQYVALKETGRQRRP